MIDASSWFGHWSFSINPPVSLVGTCATLQQSWVTHALFSPVRAVLAPDPANCNDEIVQEVRLRTSELPDGFRISVIPIVNPMFPGWRDRLIAILDDAGSLIVGVKIVPNYHDYALSESALTELATVCEARNLPLCIQLRMQDERSHHPFLKVPAVSIDAVVTFAAAHPQIGILVCGAYNAELPQLAAAPNVHVELSFVESGDTLPTALKQIDASRLLFATHHPIHDIAPAVAKLTGDDLTPDTLDAIAAGNARRLFNL